MVHVDMDAPKRRSMVYVHASKAFILLVLQIKELEEELSLLKLKHDQLQKDLDAKQDHILNLQQDLARSKAAGAADALRAGSAELVHLEHLLKAELRKSSDLELELHQALDRLRDVEHQVQEAHLATRQARAQSLAELEEARQQADVAKRQVKVWHRQAPTAYVSELVFRSGHHWVPSRHETRCCMRRCFHTC